MSADTASNTVSNTASSSVQPTDIQSASIADDAAGPAISNPAGNATAGEMSAVSPAPKAKRKRTGTARTSRTSRAKSNGEQPVTNKQPVTKKAPVTKKTAGKTGKRSVGKVQPSPASDIMETLHHEHQHVDRLLSAMEEQLELLESGQIADYALLQDMMHYFSSYPDRFHHPREDLVFCRLIERDKGFLGYVKQLEADHVDMRADSTFLLEKLQDICQQGACDEPERLKVQLQDYIDFYRMHMNLEESRVFPGIREALTEDDWHEVNRELKQQGDPLFGDIVKARYQGVSDYIENLEQTADDDVLVSASPWRALGRSMAIASGGIKEMNRVCRQRARLGWAGNKRALERALDNDEADKLSELPGLVMKRNMMHITEGIDDVRSIAKATRKRMLNKGNGKRGSKAFKRG